MPFSKLTCKVPFEVGKLEVPIDILPWPEDKEARVSVNSFGIGGANAHVSQSLDTPLSFLRGRVLI